MVERQGSDVPDERPQLPTQAGSTKDTHKHTREHDYTARPGLETVIPHVAPRSHSVPSALRLPLVHTVDDLGRALTLAPIAVIDRPALGPALAPTQHHPASRSRLEADYALALDRLEKASIEDDMLSSFKQILRHGKHAQSGSGSQQQQSEQKHRANRQQAPAQAQPQPVAAIAAQQQAAYYNTDVPTHGVVPAPAPDVPMVSPNYREEAEKIVAEERAQGERMPVYAGLESYTLIEKMGDGAFSNVYKAVEKATGRKVAVKVVRKYELNSSQNGNKHLNANFKKRPRVTERANILKEVQIMRGIDHPGVVKLYGFFESEEFYFLVLELMEGGELFHQIVKLTYFSEALSRHVIVQVAEAIRYLHEERGVVHRDIKPENLLFERLPIIPSRTPVHRQYDEEKEDEGEFRPGVGGGGIGRVKIADFGLSKIVWDEQTMTPCGTVGYTAPEIVKDERYSKSVDMWALGCVLYTLLCGFPPFYDESINVLTEKVARGYYTFLSPWWDDISGSAKDLITHLLCVDPAQRYTIDEFLAHPWIKNAPSAAPPAPTPRVGIPSNAPMDSPLLASIRAGNREGRSPGVGALKEAFDVTYAVHRMEEEGARRRAYNGPGGAGTRGFLQGLNEDEEEDEDAQVEEARRKHGEVVARQIEEHRARAAANAAAGVKEPTVQHYVGRGGANRREAEAALYDGRAGQRDRGRGQQKNQFELDIGNATLLGRRKNHVAPSPLSQQVPTQH
ncbi:MAPK-activated protein kinase Srk1 [Cryptotrichosporon argae]